MRVIANRYELRRPLGRGGMGQVWEGIDRRLNRPVAIKLISDTHPDGRDDASRRFYREARITGRLRHPGIPVLHDFGNDDGEFYLVMELVSGCTVAQLVAEVEPLPHAWAAVIGAQVCAALATAHAHNLIHRDLKPANVIVARNGAVKVLDFGLAAAREGIDFTPITQSGEVPGTAGYLAPELADGARADQASDLYAVGCVLHEMLTGHRVFESSNPHIEMSRHHSEDPTPVRRIRPDVPAEFERLILRLLEKDPSRRPRVAEQVGAELLSNMSSLSPLPGLIDRFTDAFHLYADALRLAGHRAN